MGGRSQAAARCHGTGGFCIESAVAASFFDCLGSLLCLASRGGVRGLDFIPRNVVSPLDWVEVLARYSHAVIRNVTFFLWHVDWCGNSLRRDELPFRAGC